MSPLVAFATLQAANPYAALGAAIPEASWTAFAAAERNPPPGTTRLALERQAAARWAGVLAGMRAVADAPYRFGTPAAAESPRLARLAGLAVAAARVRFADGERVAGTTLLLDTLRMARRTADATSETAAFDAFAERLADLPLAQCDRVRADADAGLGDARVASPTGPTRLRLLRLHTRIEAYRWRYLKLPARLADAAPEAETLDPAGKPFHYENRVEGYDLWRESPEGQERVRLSSKGTTRRDTERGDLSFPNWEAETCEPETRPGTLND